MKRLLSLTLLLIMASALLLPVTASAQGSEKTVRVGWYESPFNITDRHGRRSGYAYEYQRKIAAYTGWRYEYVEGSWPDLMQMLIDGKIDLMSDVSYTPERAEVMLFPNLPMGSEEYYLFINRDNTEITSDDFSTLNGKKVGANKGSYQIGLFNDWAKVHKVNAEIVELSGAPKDYLALASKCLGNVTLDFEPVAYPTKAAVVEALTSGEVDCMFPANMTDYDAEAMDAIISPAVMTTEVYAVVRQAEQQSFVIKKDLRAAVDQNNTIFDMFLSDHFPGMNVTYYPDTTSCLQAVSDNAVDCLMISNYRFSSIRRLCDKLRLTTVPTGVDLSYGFAIRQGETELYSILTRITRLVPVSNVSAALNFYSTEDAKVSFGAFVKDNFAAVVAVITSIALIIVLLILVNVRSEQRASAGEKLISAVEHDELTGLYNRSFFYEFANRIHREHPDKPMDSIVVNIDQFHSVNELNERLLNDLDHALRDHEFKVYYQPKFNVTVDPPVLSSAEALVRWQHPELGMISPDKFIPLFEENGLIQQLDRYVWREVASQMVVWRKKYGKVFPVSVNVSRIDLYDPDFLDNISALVREFGIRREDFLLEITESAYTEDSEVIVENVRKLRDAGFLIEMDDFGSGYSSLNMISTLPIDIIKPDMQFIRNAFHGHSDTRMPEAVLGIADMLYLPTIAEGVETAEQLQALRSMGCDIVQGYYFSKPIPAEQYETFIEQRLHIEEDVAPVELSRHYPRISYEDYTFDDLHDPLTGMYNYAAFDMLVRDADQYHTALLLAEVVDEKQLLAEYGQITAELVLRHVADLLRRSFRPVDHICRVSNSGFAIIMSRVDRNIQEQVTQKIERINETLGQPEHEIPPVSLAVGVAFADRLNPGGSILEDAQSALSGLKERGESGCAFH